MIKGFVSGEEKDIKRIPMRTAQLWPNLSDYSGNGVTIQSKKDGLYFSGTCNASANVTVNAPLSAGRYTLKANANRIPSDDTNACIQIYWNTSEIPTIQNRNAISGSIYFSVGSDIASVQYRIRLQNGVNYDGFILRPMLNTGGSAKPFEPYGYQEGWEVRDNQDRLIWGREDELQTTTGTIPFKGYALPVKVKSLLGNAVQNGTPAPDNIIIPEMCGVRTAQLIDYTQSESGGIDASGTPVSGSALYRSTVFTPVDIRVPLWAFYEHDLLRLYFYKSDKTFISRVEVPVNTTYQVQFPENTAYIKWTTYKSGGMDLDEVQYMKIMLNLGTTALPYEPYGWKVPFENRGENLAYGRIVNANVGPGGVIVRNSFTDEYDVAIARVENGVVYTANSYVLAFYTDEPVLGSVSYDNSRIVATMGTPTTFTAPITGYVAFRIAPGEPAMLTPGSTPKPYSPYLNETLPVYLGEVPTVRRVKKYVFTGEENITDIGDYYNTNVSVSSIAWATTTSTTGGFQINNSGNRIWALKTYFSDYTTPEAFKTYLQQQYTAGHPVTVWYILATPITGVINEPLCKISTYSDELSSTVATLPEIPTTTGQNTLTVETTLAPSKLEVSIHAKKIHYGFKIDKSNDDPESAVIYTHDAVTMTPAHMDFANDRFDYGSWENAFFVRDCYPVALNLDGTEAYRLDPDDYTKKMDGTASDIFYELLTEEPSDWSTQWKQYYTKSGDEYVLNSQSEAPTFATDTYYKLTYNSAFTGNFMMAFPKVWFYRHEDSQYNYIEISNYKLSDDWKCYAHINANGQEVDFIYLPLFKGVIVNSKLRSLPGQIPQGNTTATDEVNAATALGSRWQIWDHSSVECLNDLLTLMSKSIDSQGRFGKGRESGYNSSDTVTYGKLQTGTLIKGGKFHGFSSSYKEVKVFGIEGFWANRWDRLQGMLLVNNVWKIKMTPPYNFTGTDFVTLSNAEVPTENGYLSKVQTSEYGSIPASVTNGSSTKYFKDYFYKTATDTRVAIRGGSCSHGASCGFRCVSVYNAASYSRWSIGASPVYK